MTESPEATISRAMQDFALSRKDATTLFSQDDGERLEFCAKTADIILSSVPSQDISKVGKLVGNWILHEIGGLLTEDNRDWSDVAVTPQVLAEKSKPSLDQPHLRSVSQTVRYKCTAGDEERAHHSLSDLSAVLECDRGSRALDSL